MPLWSHEAWSLATPVYEAILRHPFIKELAAGTLPEATFRRYIAQDRLYLNDYCKVLAHIASRLHSVADTDLFLAFARDGVAVEKALHSIYVAEGTEEKSPACLFYTSLLRSQAYEPVEVEAAAVLPCFWIYREVGRHILSIATLDGNPYADWIRTYADEAFSRSTDLAIDACNRLAAASTPRVQSAMSRVFLDAARLEWLFWDSAYSNAAWSV